VRRGAVPELPVHRSPVLRSAVAEHRQARMLVWLALVGLITVVLLLGWWSTVSLLVVVVAAVVTFLDPPSRTST
jgi:fatty acid desaturase